MKRKDPIADMVFGPLIQEFERCRDPRENPPRDASHGRFFPLKRTALWN
jgi:hypothetical protein